MLIAANNPIETVKSMKAGDMAVVEFKDYKKFRSFTVQLSDYNMMYGRERNIYVHAASKKRKLQYCLVATTADEREAELTDFNLKGEWKKQIPEEWWKIEYKKTLDMRIIEIIKGAYDGVGRARMDMDRGKQIERTPVDYG